MPPATEFPVIPVPTVDTLPVPFDPVSFADHLLTVLLRSGGGFLHAEWGAGGDARYLLCADPLGAGPDRVIASAPTKSAFRTVLARFGHHYMGGQLYGGAAEVVLSQAGQEHLVAVYTANDARRGYRLRVYAPRFAAEAAT